MKLAGIVWIFLITVLVITASTASFGENTTSQKYHMVVNNVEHKEITFSDGIIAGLPVVNRPLSLDEAIEIGLKNSLGIKISQSETDIRKAMLKEAKAQRWPELTVGALTFLRTDDNQTLMTPDMMMNTVNSTLFQDLNSTVSFPIFTGGRIRGGIRAARFSLLGSESLLQQTVAETAYEIREAYLTALFAEEEHLVHQSHIEVQQELLQNAEARYRVGRGLKADVLRVEAELANGRRMLNEEHNSLNTALFDLKGVLGIDLASPLTTSDSLQYKPWSGPDLQNLLQEAVSTNPRVEEVKNMLKEAEAQVRITKSQYLPQIYGQITGNVRFPDRPPEMGNGIIGMVRTNLPVFSRARSAEIQRREAELKRAQEEYKARQLEVAQDIAKAWTELVFASDNVVLAEPAVAQAQENFRLIERRFSVGRAISVEVQDAAFVLREAQLNRAEALYNHELAKARLLLAIRKPYL